MTKVEEIQNGRQAEAATPAAVSKPEQAIVLSGQRVCLRPSGAMWIEEVRALVVADLHLEKGSAYAARGQMLPPWDTRETLTRLRAEVAATQPDMIISLGDALHDAAAGERFCADDLSDIGALTAAARFVWIAGNHDRDGLAALPGEITEEMVFGDLVLRHEPVTGADHGWAAGHLHPCARVKGRTGSVRRRCFVTDGARIILPAFGAYAGGLNVRDQAYAGMFRGKPTAVVLGRERAYPVRWTSLVGD